MNNYYHPVSITFNWWMVVAVVNCFIMFAVGAQQYMLKNLKLKRRYNEKVFVFVSALLAIVTGIMFIMESIFGYVQVIANHLGPNDAPDYAVWIAILTLPILMAVYGLILYFISTVAVIWKRGKLREERNRIVRERRRRERRMKQNDDNMDPWVY